MSIMERLVSVVAPHTCLGCGCETDRLVCENCRPLLIPAAPRCYHCKRTSAQHLTCSDCANWSPLTQVVVAYEYQSLARELVHRMKYERAQAGAREIGDLFTGQLPYIAAPYCLVAVPTATSRVRLRGYDHTQIITRTLAAKNHLPSARPLLRLGQAHQMGSTRSQRLHQLDGAFRVTGRAGLAGQHIVLVDDVLTTGATLESAARTLIQAGAARVDALVFAQA
jgi:ComF family protein